MENISISNKIGRDKAMYKNNMTIVTITTKQYKRNSYKTKNSLRVEGAVYDTLFMAYVDKIM